MTPPGDLSLDRLADRIGVGGGALQVATLEDLRVGAEQDADPVREPHRHDYHELIWVRSGSGVHHIDGEPYAFRPGTATLIGRGQVHTVQEADGLNASVVRFGDELLSGRMSWLVAGGGARVVAVPRGLEERLGAVVAALAAEARRPPDERTALLEHHLLTVLLLWIERWYDAARTEARPADDAQVELHRRFVRLLEQDFARHHDAAHYADVLGVPAAALSRALSEATGRTTKDLVVDRVMLEAARLLRYTDRGVGEIAHATGFTDPLYFSRAFKRRVGEPPMAYRDRVRGKKSMHP
jgi:AraC family transcriptional activator of pobA